MSGNGEAYCSLTAHQSKQVMSLIRQYRLQDGFHHVRSYGNTRTPTEQQKQRIYSDVNNKQYPLTPKSTR